MWGIEPNKLCNKHLLGERVEMLMFLGTLRKGNNIKGYIEKGLVNPPQIVLRFEQLTDEGKARGMNMTRKIKIEEYRAFFSYLKNDCSRHELDLNANLEDLVKRCSSCCLINSK